MTKRELSQLFWLNREIALNKAKIAELEARAASTSAVLSDMPRGNLPGDKVGRLAAEIADERGIYLANLQKREREKKRLLRYIESGDDSLMRQILLLRHVEGLKWQEVADRVGTNENAVKQAYSRFLKKDVTHVTE